MTFYQNTYSPFSPSSVVIEDIITPILPVRTTLSNIPHISNIPQIIPRVNVVTGVGVTSVYNPNSLFYYDSGIGESHLAQHETNVDLRYKFLDKWLYEDYPEILRMLKVEPGSVKVVSKNAEATNDISKDTEGDLERKSDFIGYEILTLEKNKKILDALCRKNNLKYYDLPHNEHFVRKAQSKYVKSKLEELRK